MTFACKWTLILLKKFFVQHTALLALFLTHGVLCQTIPDDPYLIKIESIESGVDDFQDLQPLKSLWKDKRIILLGEQSHGDGATFEARVRLIKFLHQEMGFDIVAFESGMYDNYHAYKTLISEEKQTTSPFKKSILPIWSETKENNKLIEYVESMAKSETPLQIAGFDFIRNDFFKYRFWEDLKVLFHESPFSNSDILQIEQVMLTGTDLILDGHIDSVSFFSTADKIQNFLRSQERTSPTERSKIISQSFKTWVFGVRYELGERTGKHYYVQNPRDSLMAENLIFLSELYPEKKIIGIGASMHFSNQVLNFKNTDLTKEYIARMSQKTDEEGFFDLDKAMEGAVPMGQLLKSHFGNQLYSLAFSSYEGEFGVVDASKQVIPTPPDESLEAEMIVRKISNCIIDFNSNSISKEWFYLSALGNLPIYAKWKTIFDGLFFIKTSYPPSPIAYNLVNISTDKSSKSIYGRIVDKSTKQVIPFVNISLMGISKGVSSNEKGEFSFYRLTENDSKLVFSSIGFENDTIGLADIKDRNDLLVEMNPKTYLLNQVTITDKPLEAKDIIRKAGEKKSENYYQLPMNQEFFFSSTHFRNDSITHNEESSVLIYGEQGYKSTNNVSSHFYGNILQYRNATKKPTLDKWEGVGSMWLVLTHDVILDKANVLNRTNSYDLEILRIVEYNSHLAYEISFVCKSPNATTVGFGYPSPKAASGKIFIDVNSYAVLKYEVCVNRGRYENTKRNLITDPFRHHLIQTYKSYKGKYFLNTSISYNYYHYEDTKKDVNWTYGHLAILNSTEVEIDNVKPIERPIRSLAVGELVKEDLEFWSSHNFMILNKEVPNFNCDR